MKMSEIINMRNNGATYQEIADAVGMSKQRVRTIIINHSPELKGTRGSALRRANDLIDRLQADKKGLINGQETLQNYIKKLQAEIERLKDDFESKVLIQVEANCRYKEKELSLLKDIQNRVKSEAVNEFVKKFEKKIKNVKFTIGQTWEIKCALKQTLQEMTEVKE